MEATVIAAAREITTTAEFADDLLAGLECLTNEQLALVGGGAGLMVVD